MESILFKNFHILLNVGSHDCDSPQLISFWIFQIKKFGTEWNDTRQVHFGFMFLYKACILFFDNGFSCSFVFDILVLMQNISSRSFLPVFKILFVVGDEHRHVVTLELIYLFFLDNDKKCRHDFGAVSVDEVLFENRFLIFIHNIS